MGQGGTDVAREAASLVLLDDNFATIVGAVREGRRIFDNIRKFIRYALTGNSGEIWVLFLAPLLGLPIPLLPIHILWVNLVTDGLPGLALAAEPAERGVMQRPPRPPRESVFAHGLWQHALWVGLLIGGAVPGRAGLGAARAANAHWQTMVFTALTLAQMAHVLAIRSERDSLFTQGLLEQPAAARRRAADAGAAAGDDLPALAAAGVSHRGAVGRRTGAVLRLRSDRLRCRRSGEGDAPHRAASVATRHLSRRLSAAVGGSAQIEVGAMSSVAPARFAQPATGGTGGRREGQLAIHSPPWAAPNAGGEADVGFRTLTTLCVAGWRGGCAVPVIRGRLHDSYCLP